MKCLLLAACVFAGLRDPLWGQSTAAPPEPPGIAWEGDFDEALKKARKESRPLMVAIVLRGEPANEELCDEHFHDAAIVAQSRKFVCLLALGLSRNEKGPTDGTDRILQDLAGHADMNDLLAVERDVRLTLLESNEVSAPQFIFLHPDGKTVLLRHVWMLPKAELLRKMQQAHYFFDPSAPAPEGLEREKAMLADLLKRCDDNNMVARREAMTELAALDHPEVIAFLIRQASPSVAVQRRLEAIRAMGQPGQAKFLPALHGLLRENDYQIRTNVSEALRAIGLVESAPRILKTLAQEKKDNVRSLLIRALTACAPAAKETRDLLKRLLERGSDLDKVTVLHVLAGGPAIPEFHPAVLKAVKASSDRVRACAYFVVGTHQLTEATEALKKRLSTEKQAARKACTWALAELGEPPPGETIESPAGDLQMLLPPAAW